MDELNEELIRKFREVCAVDETQAIQFLRHCEGNLEEAVQLFFGSGGSLDGGSPSQENEINNENELRRRNLPSNPVVYGNSGFPHEPNISPPLGWVQWFQALVTMPIQFFWHSLWDLIGVIVDFFAGYTRPAVTDPIGDVAHFLEQQRYLLPASSLLPFAAAGFSETARAAKRQLKPLLVYLHSHSEDSVRFLRESLASSQFSEFLVESECILWGAGSDRPEGRSVAFHLRARSFPFLGLLYFDAGRMILVTRTDRFVNAEDLTFNFTTKFQEIRSSIVVQRFERAQREEDALLREQQNREYEESAKKDRERTENKKREEALRLANEATALAAKEKIRLRNEKLQAYRSALLEAPSTGSVRVQVRFPSGDRKVLHFLDNTSAVTVFDAIYQHSSCPIYFSVASVVPRKVLNLAPKWYVEFCAENEADGGTPLGTTPADSLTIDDVGILNGTTLMVHDLNA